MERRDRAWPLCLAALVALFALFCIWSFHRAAVEGSPLVDARYYERGLHYDQEAAAERVAEDQGWSLRIGLHGARIAVRITNREGRLVSGATAAITLNRPDRSEVDVPLPEVQPGTYGAALPFPLRGPTPARLDLALGEARTSRSLLLHP